MDHEMLKILEKCRKANGRVTRLIAVGGKPLRQAKATREKAEAAFEALCARRAAEAADLR